MYLRQAVNGGRHPAACEDLLSSNALSATPVHVIVLSRSP